jgi:hypothetical protein
MQEFLVEKYLPAHEYLLSDDPIIDEQGKERSKSRVFKSSADSIARVEEHESVWKTRIWGRNRESENMPLHGVTVVLHIEGQDDLLLRQI